MLDKYNEIWGKIKRELKKYIKAEVREFNGVTKTNVLGDEIPKENVHYTCVAYKLLILL